MAWTRSGRSSGAAPSALLAHGLTDSAATWDRVAAALAPSYDVVRYDARGHGLSDRATSYPFELHVGDLIGLCRALQLDRPVLIGHSMGGAVATVAAAELTARALILEEPHWPEIPEEGTGHDVGAGRRKLVEVAALPETERWAYGRAEHPTWADVDLGAWVLAQGQLDPEVITWFDSWPTINRWRDHLASLRCPGLLLIGDGNPSVTKAAAEARERWPQLQVVQIEGAGHNIRRDRFELYWSAVAAFLATLINDH